MATCTFHKLLRNLLNIEGVQLSPYAFELIFRRMLGTVTKGLGDCTMSAGVKKAPSCLLIYQLHIQLGLSGPTSWFAYRMGQVSPWL